MSAANIVAIDKSTEDRLGKEVFGEMFAEAARKLLNTPMSDPVYRRAVTELNALLIAWDADKAAS